MDYQNFHPVSQLGFHYFPDTLHYRQSDLETWAPELQRMGASWLTLLAPAGRFIPEFFLQGLLQAGIQPLLHFPFRAEVSIAPDEWQETLALYHRWGVQTIALFDRPNSRSAWSASNWVQAELVERFLDVFLPLAQIAQQEGLTTIFPPLEPGGDYWDLAFLYSALLAIRRRGNDPLLSTLAVGAYAWAGNRALDWGAGGPARWPGARPYHTPPGVQDHLGFYIFEWYLEVCRQALGRTLPVYLLRMGSRLGDQQDPTLPVVDARLHAARNLALARVLAGQEPRDLPALPAEVAAGCFWVLGADPGSPHSGDAWFTASAAPSPTFAPQPAVLALRRLIARPDQITSGQSAPGQVTSLSPNPPSSPKTQVMVEAVGEQVADQPLTDLEPELSLEGNASQASPILADAGGVTNAGEFDMEVGQVEPNGFHADSEAAERKTAEGLEPAKDTDDPAGLRKIQHYVLLPLYGWGVAEWDLNLIEPLLQTAHPTIGFSLAEARLAERVTVVGSEQVFSDEALGLLRQSGCFVERILEDGTVVAT